MVISPEGSFFLMASAASHPATPFPIIRCYRIEIGRLGRVHRRPAADAQERIEGALFGKGAVNMPEKVTVLEDLQIIKVDSYGDVTAADLKESLEAVVRIRKERGLTRVFVDATKVTSLPDTFSAFDFGQLMANAIQGLRVAVVGSKMLAKDLGFIQTVAQNRGGMIQVFDTKEDALAWLIDESNS